MYFYASQLVEDMSAKTKSATGLNQEVNKTDEELVKVKEELNKLKEEVIKKATLHRTNMGPGARKNCPVGRKLEQSQTPEGSRLP